MAKKQTTARAKQARPRRPKKAKSDAEIIAEAHADLEAAQKRFAPPNRDGRGIPQVPGRPADQALPACRHGRLASEVQPRTLQWLVPGLVPVGCLTMIVGEPSSGKSTLGAHLAARAMRTVMLPGYEESTEAAIVPRLHANGVELSRVLLLDARPWYLPMDRERITEICREWQAQLLWLDPLDSYLPDGAENDGPAVRAMLEALSRIADEAGLAVVGVRHPGKVATNPCPGSRSWKAVPRLIWRLTVDSGPPERRVCSILKESIGLVSAPRLYLLEREGDRPPRLTWAGDLEEREKVSLEVEDRTERRVLDIATDFLRGLLAAGELPSKVIYAHAETERLGDRAIRRAADRLGVQVRREGTGLEHRAIWALPGREGGVSQSVGRSD